jgi:hypothetical protein
MLRVAFAVVGSLALMAPVALPDVDAVTFATAFRGGTADQYKNKQVSGTGVSFHGAIQERIADGSTRTSLVITLGSVAPGGKSALLKTWDEFVAAERTRTTLVVALSGPDLPAPPASGPTTYDFTGVYDGQVRTIMRAPQSGDATKADTGPCPGEQPRQGEGGASFYCAPLLTGAKATPAK